MHGRKSSFQPVQTGPDRVPPAGLTQQRFLRNLQRHLQHYVHQGSAGWTCIEQTYTCVYCGYLQISNSNQIHEYATLFVELIKSPTPTNISTKINTYASTNQRHYTMVHFKQLIIILQPITLQKVHCLLTVDILHNLTSPLRLCRSWLPIDT